MSAQGLEDFFKTPEAPVVADRKRDFGLAAARLKGWLQSKMPSARVLELGELEYPRGAGTSNETILFTARWQESGREVSRRFVARMHPGDFQLFLDPAFDRQIRLLRLLRDKGWVRVPNVLWDEEDASVLGQPFFIMEHVPGRIPVTFPQYNVSGFLADASVPERERAWLSAMDQFTRVHRIAAAEVDFMLRPEYGATGLEDELNYWFKALDWTGGGNIPPLYVAARQWLSENLPASPPEGLSWGDCRIGNMIFDDRFEVAAVLDWEQASFAGGLQDLGWWLVTDEIFSTGLGVKRLEGLGTRRQTIDLWQERTGQKVRDLPWFEVFAAFKGAILAMRKSRLEHRFVAGSNAGNNVFSRFLAARLDQEPPADMA